MRRIIIHPTRLGWHYALLVAAFLLSACSPTAYSQAASTPTLPVIFAMPLAITTPATPGSGFSAIPEAARAASHQGDPRPAGYWMLWNRCAEDNRAGAAAANGGREAGWYLLDDLIADPGIQLGDYPLTTCQAGLHLLQGQTALGKQTNDPIYALASALLTAELNLGVGAETCPIAEEAVVGGHLVLSNTGFNGQGAYELSSEIASAIPRLVELLEDYNRGELCR